MTDARVERTIHPEARDHARLAIGAAVRGEQAAVHRHNQALVAWHQARATCPQRKARAARTLEHLGERLRNLEPRPQAPEYRPPAHPIQPPVEFERGELKREILETLLAVDYPLSVREVTERVNHERTATRKALKRMEEAGIVVEVAAHRHRPDLDYRTAGVWTTTDRAAALAA